jgi:hypothetical protein
LLLAVVDLGALERALVDCFTTAQKLQKLQTGHLFL